MNHTPECFASHMGLWLMKWDVFSTGCKMIASGVMPTVARCGDADADPEQPYYIADGIAVVSINGAMTKASTKFGTSTIATRRAIRQASMDPAADGIMIHVDSPGGTVSGTGDLAGDIRAADRMKPVYVHADDLIASAAYWAGAQGRRVTLNATGEAGSIGVMGLAYDTSEQAKMEGVRPVLIRAGEHKGDFTDGLPITEEMIARHQVRVDEINEMFVEAIAKGRRVPIAKAREWNTGETWGAVKAKEMGLIDAIASFDEAMDFARREVQAAKRERIADKRRDVRMRTA